MVQVSHARATTTIAIRKKFNNLKRASMKDNGAQFTYELLLKHLRPKNLHPFELLCQKHAIKHKLTKFRHPWANSQLERINQAIKDATTKTYH